MSQSLSAAELHALVNRPYTMPDGSSRRALWERVPETRPHHLVGRIDCVLAYSRKVDKHMFWVGTDPERPNEKDVSWGDYVPVDIAAAFFIAAQARKSLSVGPRQE